MNKQAQNRGAASQIWHFILHLRWHYQLFILSGGYLLGGFLSTNLNLTAFLTQFINVHLLLFGGATAYNSFWDKDKGPIGGLKNPPPMDSWMWPVSLLLQLLGLMIAIFQGFLFTTVFIASMIFFWLYSTPLARWKKYPLKSLVAIGISTGFNSVLLGYLAAGNMEIPFYILVAATGVTLMLLSLYPISQIYQVDDDLKRGDTTFAVTFGKEGIILFFAGAFFTGLALVSFSIIQMHFVLGILFAGVGIATGITVWWFLEQLAGKSDEYQKVMWIKYGTSLSFVLFLIAGLILKHADINGISGVANLLLE